MTGIEETGNDQNLVAPSHSFKLCFIINSVGLGPLWAGFHILS